MCWKIRISVSGSVFRPVGSHREQILNFGWKQRAPEVRTGVPVLRKEPKDLFHPGELIHDKRKMFH